ncbi:MAG: hypothetical protein WD851_16440 [Pirellulales bacterium]
MRTLVLLLLMLAGLGQAAVRLDTAARPSAGESQPSPWVRTVQGWEQLDTLRTAPVAQLALHPGVVAAGLLCGSMLVLLAWNRDE